MEGDTSVEMEQIHPDSQGSFGSKPIECNLEFKNINYTINSSGVETHILKGVSAVLEPGQVTAVLGASGSGKTTLLNALAGRLKDGDLSGEVLINGELLNKQSKRLISYILQDDILHENLTVEETLELTALLRLPNELSITEKMDVMNKALVALGLDKCRKSQVGGVLERGISGGERKRLNIGNEILNNPSILMLDEPTSGLDASTALAVTKLFHRFASEGRVVLCSIHQPSSRIFYEFDKIILMCEGSMAYYGTPKDLVPYFQSLGFPCEEHFNPADFCLELMTSKHGKDLVKSYSPQPETSSVHDVPVSTLVGKKWQTNWTQQFLILFRRAFIIRQRESIDLLKFIQFTSLAVLIGLLYELNSNEDTLTARLGLVFFSAIFWMFDSSYTAMMLFPAEHAIVVKERAAGTYRLSPYFLSKMLCETPFSLIFPTLYNSIVYYMAGLNPAADRFVLHLISFWLMVLNAESFGIFLSAAMVDLRKTTALLTVSSLFFMMAGGFFVEADIIPEWLQWLQYVSFFRLGYHIIAKVELDGETFTCLDTLSQYSSCPITGQDVLEKNGLDDPVWISVLLLIGWAFIYRIGALFFLRRNTR